MARGRLVLCGSGEFTPAMDEVDREILDGIAVTRPRVAIVPTAAGQEETPNEWAEMGVAHFGALRAEGVPIMVLSRADAFERRWCEAVASADWIYFSGGKPQYAVDTLAGTPFWAAVLARLAGGAVLAGSSAGAMMLGEHTIAPEGFDDHGMPRVVTMRGALGVLPGLFVAPHFDIIPEEALRKWLRVWPAGARMLGIDEDTALVQQHEGWDVRGKGRVLSMTSFDAREVYRKGTRFDGIRVIEPPPVLQ